MSASRPNLNKIKNKIENKITKLAHASHDPSQLIEAISVSGKTEKKIYTRFLTEHLQTLNNTPDTGIDSNIGIDSNKNTEIVYQKIATLQIELTTHHSIKLDFAKLTVEPYTSYQLELAEKISRLEDNTTRAKIKTLIDLYIANVSQQSIDVLNELKEECDKPKLFPITDITDITPDAVQTLRTQHTLIVANAVLNKLMGEHLERYRKQLHKKPSKAKTLIEEALKTTHFIKEMDPYYHHCFIREKLNLLFILQSKDKKEILSLAQELINQTEIVRGEEPYYATWTYFLISSAFFQNFQIKEACTYLTQATISARLLNKNIFTHETLHDSLKKLNKSLEQIVKEITSYSISSLPTDLVISEAECIAVIQKTIAKDSQIFHQKIDNFLKQTATNTSHLIEEPEILTLVEQFNHDEVTKEAMVFYHHSRNAIDSIFETINLLSKNYKSKKELPWPIEEVSTLLKTFIAMIRRFDFGQYNRDLLSVYEKSLNYLSNLYHDEGAKSFIEKYKNELSDYLNSKQTITPSNEQKKKKNKGKGKGNSYPKSTQKKTSPPKINYKKESDEEKETTESVKTEKANVETNKHDSLSAINEQELGKQPAEHPINKDAQTHPELMLSQEEYEVLQKLNNNRVDPQSIYLTGMRLAELITGKISKNLFPTQIIIYQDGIDSKNITGLFGDNAKQRDDKSKTIDLTLNDRKFEIIIILPQTADLYSFLAAKHAYSLEAVLYNPASSALIDYFSGLNDLKNNKLEPIDITNNTSMISSHSERIADLFKLKLSWEIQVLLSNKKIEENKATASPASELPKHHWKQPKIVSVGTSSASHFGGKNPKVVSKRPDLNDQRPLAPAVKKF